MAHATNLLTFSLSPMEKVLSSFDLEFVQYDTASAYSSHHYFLDNFCANAWTNPILNSVQVEQNQSEENQAHNMADIHLTSLMNSQNQNQSVVPKLEDQTETQDSSSLTQIYHFDYFINQQDLKATSGFSINSVSEVNDSASIAKQQATPCEFGSAHHSVESSRNELAFCSSSKGTSSLDAVTDKAVAAVDSDGLKKIGDRFGQRTSIFRGVTRHRWTGRYEAHLWDNSCRREGQARKGRQVYLGGYDKEEKAARAYDLAALKYRGPTATTNYPVSNYTKELEEMKHAGKQEFIAALRRKSSGFSRGASIYRGVTRHHQQGRWQARIGRVAGNKDLYLGTFATEEEAAEAYDIAAIKFRGSNAVTNFETSRYDVEAILKNSLPVGGVAKRLKLSLESENKAPMSDNQQPQCTNLSSSINFSTIQPVASMPFDSETAYYHHNLFQHFQLTNAGNGTGESAVTISNAMTLPPAAEFLIWPHQSY